ncbi:MAG: hypothetical protein DYG94_03965 [Leptolyngbya sp. PLA3]|nr:hypothetical protein [Leptolyngbya sp. PL-A3]
MPRNPTPKPFKTPAYWARSVYDQAIVTLTDSATKRRRDYWLGEYGTPASRELYYRLIAVTRDRVVPLRPARLCEHAADTTLSLIELLLHVLHDAPPARRARCFPR